MTQPAPLPQRELRAILAGSHSWTNEQAITNQLNKLMNDCSHLTLVCGGSPQGPDEVARQWVRKQPPKRVTLVQYRADHTLHGDHASDLSTRRMFADGGDLLLAFLGPCREGIPRTAPPTASEGHGASESPSPSPHPTLPVKPQGLRLQSESGNSPWITERIHGEPLECTNSPDNPPGL